MVQPGIHRPLRMPYPSSAGECSPLPACSGLGKELEPAGNRALPSPVVPDRIRRLSEQPSETFARSEWFSCRHRSTNSESRSKATNLLTDRARASFPAPWVEAKSDRTTRKGAGKCARAQGSISGKTTLFLLLLLPAQHRLRPAAGPRLLP